MNDTTLLMSNRESLTTSKVDGNLSMLRSQRSKYRDLKIYDDLSMVSYVDIDGVGQKYGYRI